LFTFLGWEHFSRRLEGLNCRYLLDR
jgi:hypothetical protein